MYKPIYRRYSHSNPPLSSSPIHPPPPTPSRSKFEINLLYCHIGYIYNFFRQFSIEKTYSVCTIATFSTTRKQNKYFILTMIETHGIAIISCHNLRQVWSAEFCSTFRSTTNDRIWTRNCRTIVSLGCPPIYYMLFPCSGSTVRLAVRPVSG